jgi:Na+-driven multidrug efflux pump
MLTAIILNVILDPLLIFGIGPFPRMELAGAAIATVIARFVTLVVSLLFLHFKFNMITFESEGISATVESWKKVVFIGIPAAFTQVLIPLSMGFITKLIAAQGESAIAAFGVCCRLEMFFLSPLMSLGAVITPFTGQNFGAGKIDRIKHGLKYSSIFSMILGLLIWTIFYFGGEFFGSIFNDSKEVEKTVALYFFFVAGSYGFHGLSMLTASVLNALNKPFIALTVNFVKLVVLLVPLCYFGGNKWGLKGIFSGIAISYFISGLGAWIYMQQSLRKLDRSLANPALSNNLSA